jgi:hypothetical protein
MNAFSPPIVQRLAEALKANEEARSRWQSAAATLRLEVGGESGCLDSEGELSDVEPTHTMRIDAPDLEALLLGERTFLGTVTHGRVVIQGPIMQSMQMGAAMQGVLDANRTQEETA